MFSYISYAIIAFVVALVLTLFGVVIKPLKLRDEQRPGRVFITWFILALVLPYLFVETLTRTVGKSMKPVIIDAYENAKFQGPFLYYKVLFTNGTKAKALAIGQERQEWGGMDRPMISINLVKKNDKWECENYRVVISDRLNKECIVFPPYW